MINVFKYNNYRLYLEDYMKDQKVSGQIFSYRKFSMRAGFRSPNFLKLIIDGDRNLSLSSAEKVAKALPIHGAARRFFLKLVKMNQTKAIEERKKLANEVLQSQKREKTLLLKNDVYEYYKNWYNVPIRESFLVNGGEGTALELAEAFSPKLTPQEVTESIKVLESLGMISKNKDKNWQIKNTSLTTGDFITHAYILSFHKKMMELAIESLINFPSKEREIGTVTVPLSKKSFIKVQEQIKKLRKKVLKAAEEETDPEEVYQLNVQLFPLTKGLKKKDR